VNLSVFQDKALFDFLKKYNEKLRQDEADANRVADSAIWGEMENLNENEVRFHAAYGKGQSKTGHGIYAEEAGAILDNLEKSQGEKVEVVGRNNQKDGPDKIVNGNPVQCKFCKTPGSSIRACFKRNPETGEMKYRYIDVRSGNPMKVEVPSDQYEKALEIMRQRIEQGQVPGVTDPNMAKDLVRKSKLTYAQAKNLAKAGTFESLTFDTATGVVNCSFAAGISSLCAFGLTYWKTNDPKKAKDAAIDTAINVFGKSLAANIISNQIARTNLSNVLIPISDKIAEQLGNKIVQKLINSRRILAGQKKIYGNAANKSMAKALRSNVIAEGVSFVIFSIPDTWKVTSGKISGAQYTKNMLSSFTSLCGSIASTYIAGLAAGAVGEKMGKKVDIRLGAVIGFVAGAGGGFLSGYAVNKLTGLFKEDDCVITARLFNAVIVNMAIEYLMDEKEVDKLIQALDNKSKEIGKFQIKLRTSKRQYHDTHEFLEPYFVEAVKDRKEISKLEEEKIFYIEETDLVGMEG
jgi:hypothetical protein